MKPEDIEKLLAGYARGTLDEAERRVLMRAALEHQELFDALAEEEALRELLPEPQCRRQLLELLGVRPLALWQRALAWLRRPVGIAALASTTAAAVPVSSLLVHMSRQGAAEPEPLAQAPPGSASTPVPTASRYSILRQGVETPPDTTFGPGEPLQLRVQGKRTGCILLFRVESGGALRLRFPNRDADNRIQPGAELVIPLAPRPKLGEDTLVLALVPETPGEAKDAALLREIPRATGLRATPAPPADPRLHTEIGLGFR